MKWGGDMEEKELAIIVIEDSPDDAELLLYALRSASFNFHARRVDTAENFEKLLNEGLWDIIISDYSMPRFDGLTALQIVKSRGLETPFIMVSGQRGENFAVEVMKAGAHDFIVKSNLSRLGPAVNRELAEAKNRLARKEAESNIQRQNERLRLINETAKDLLSHLDLSEVFQMILERAASILGVDNGLIFIFDSLNFVYEVKAARGILIPQIGMKTHEKTGMIANVLASKEPLVIEDYSGWEKRNPHPGFNQVKAALAVPLAIEGEVAGIIFFGATDPAFRFLPGAEVLLNELASLASIAIDNARMYQNLQKELEERKRSETKSSRYREIIERTKDMILVVNSQGHIVDANQAALANYGYTMEELRRLRGELLRPPDCKEQLSHFIQEALVRNSQLETVHMRKDKSRFPVEVATGLIDLEDGPGFVSIVRDITYRKKAETELRSKVNELAEVVDNLRKTQTQMIQQEKMAGIGQLAAGVAHEINNPLGFVLSNFETLQLYTRDFIAMLAAYKNFRLKAAGLDEEGLAAGIKELIEAEKAKNIDFLVQDVGSLFGESRNGLDRVTQIVKGLRSFSRDDKLNVFAEYDLNEGVESTLTVARNEIKYNADVETELGILPMILASSGQINQVLMNIIVNAAQAIKSMGENKRGIIRIKTFTEGNRVGCSIYDDGPPIPPRIIDRIFEPFFTTKKVGQGTGLGLSISYDIIVNLHHGQFSVVSSEEEGTTFTFYLPIMPMSEEENLSGKDPVSEEKNNEKAIRCD